jgi:hypothetical protein
MGKVFVPMELRVKEKGPGLSRGFSLVSLLLFYGFGGNCCASSTGFGLIELWGLRLDRAKT